MEAKFGKPMKRWNQATWHNGRQIGEEGDKNLKNDKYKTNSNNKSYVPTILLEVGILQIHCRVFWIFSPCWCDNNYWCFRGTSCYLLEGQKHRRKFQKTYVWIEQNVSGHNLWSKEARHSSEILTISVCSTGCVAQKILQRIWMNMEILSLKNEECFTSFRMYL